MNIKIKARTVGAVVSLVILMLSYSTQAANLVANSSASLLESLRLAMYSRDARSLDCPATTFNPLVEGREQPAVWFRRFHARSLQ